MRATVVIRAAAAPDGAWRLDDDEILMLCINLFVVRTASKIAGDRGGGPSTEWAAFPDMQRRGERAWNCGEAGHSGPS